MAGLKTYIDELLERYPQLVSEKEHLTEAYMKLQICFQNGGKLLVAGNGGSTADAEHIAGELMKGFRIKRSISEELRNELIRLDMGIGSTLASKLEGALTTIALTSQDALSTAYMNDVDATGVFAQKILGYGKSGDVFLAISTSGNSVNIIYAALVAKAMGMQVIGLTGRSGGRLKSYCDVTVYVPEDEPYKIQELHLPIYHVWCLMLEEFFWGMEKEDGRT